MADEAASPPPASGGSDMDKAKGLLDNPIAVLILGFVTCGIVPLWWMWVRAKEMNDALGKEQVKPLFIFPGCICFPVMIYAMWLFAQGVNELKKKKGGEVKDETILHFVLFLFITPVAEWMIQQQWNDLVKK